MESSMPSKRKRSGGERYKLPQNSTPGEGDRKISTNINVMHPQLHQGSTTSQGEIDHNINVTHPRPQSSAPDEVEYKKIEDNIKNELRLWREAFQHRHPDYSCPIILTLVVEQSAGKLDSHYGDLRNAIELLNNRHDLKQKLLTAWKSESFRDILDLDYLQSASPSEPWNSAREQEHTKRVLQAVQTAWKLPYQGTYHKLLFQNINNIFRREPYLNICSIVQSSGTGKSRMVHEQSSLVFTLPINIRTKKGIDVTYPPSDEPLHDYLVQTPDDVDECKRRYVVFFSSLFSHTAEELMQFKNQRQQTQGEFSRMWRERMSDETYRNSFYVKMVKTCNSVSKKLEPRLLVSEARSNLDTLIHSLDGLCEITSQVKIVIYVDEAHELNGRYSSKEKQFTQLDILSSVLAEFCEWPLFCIYLSTQSSLSFLARPGAVAPSERAHKQADALLAPITETPFDCAPDFKVHPHVLRVSNLSEIDYLAKWGRPLWWTMLNDQISAGDRKELEYRLVNFARMKLLCQQNIHVPHDTITSTARLAVLDVLLALDFEPSRSKTLQEDMIRSHMRIAYSVVQHHEYSRSGYSSEPLLAEAALQQIHEFQNHVELTSINVMVEILKSAFDTTLIDLGQRGEVVMRLLLMRAYMDGVLNSCPSLATPINFSRGCRLVTFIQRLFSSAIAEQILDSKPCNIIQNTTFRSAFKLSLVRFTHFVKVVDTSALSTEALFAAFARGMAFICHQTQDYVDFAIPVLLNETSTLQESAMTAILVQVKRRLTGRGPTAYTFSQGQVELFPKAGDDRSPDRPYIILIAELGAKPRGRPPTPTSIAVSSQPEVQHYYLRDTHPCFSVTAYGCSDTLYRVINKEQNAAYIHLLATHGLLEEHPRKDRGSRSAVMKLKPYLRRGEDSYHWMDSWLAVNEPE